LACSLELAAKHGVWRHRQALSTSFSSKQSLCAVLAGLYPYNSIISIHTLAGIRLQLRCNPDSGKGGTYTFFSSEFAVRRGQWRRPCVKCRFILTLCYSFAAARRLYIQNEGLRGIFWEDRANEDAK
jgi:hypothetical protein